MPISASRIEGHVLKTRNSGAAIRTGLPDDDTNPDTVPGAYQPLGFDDSTSHETGRLLVVGDVHAFPTLCTSGSVPQNCFIKRGDTYDEYENCECLPYYEEVP